MILCLVAVRTYKYIYRIFLWTGLSLAGMETNDRDEPCWRKLNLLPGETKRRRIRIPLLDLKV
ncbi:MAG: hypothetical protein GXY61_03740 [Lentisphaerae bacterium]|nr:hypothetical protein [Lentisphaerota bacterium]